MIQILILVLKELIANQTGVNYMYASPSCLYYTHDGRGEVYITIHVLQYIPCLFHHVCSEDMKRSQQAEDIDMIQILISVQKEVVKGINSDFL